MCEYRSEGEGCPVHPEAESPTYVTNPEHPDHLPVMLSDLSPHQLELFVLFLVHRKGSIENGFRALETEKKVGRTILRKPGEPQSMQWTTYYPEVHRSAMQSLVEQIKTPIAAAVSETVRMLLSGQLDPQPNDSGDLAKIHNDIADSYYIRKLTEELGKAIADSSISPDWFTKIRQATQVANTTDEDVLVQSIRELLIDSNGNGVSIPISAIYMGAEFGTFSVLIRVLRDAWVYGQRFTRFAGIEMSSPSFRIRPGDFQKALPEGIVTCPAAKLMMFYMRLFQRVHNVRGYWEMLVEENVVQRLVEASEYRDARDGVEWFLGRV